MSLQWDESLELGIEEIDNQHRSIFEHFKQLSEAAQEGTSKEVVEDLVAFLNDYTQAHFATEDKLMVEYRYPKIDEQRHEHSEFTKDIRELKRRIEDKGATREISLEITGKLLRWIIQHVKNHDKIMVEYVKECIALRQKYDN